MRPRPKPVLASRRSTRAPAWGGHCLDGEEVICLRDPEGVHVLRFRGRVRPLPRRRAQVLSDGTEVVCPQGPGKPLSIDPRKPARLVFAPVTHLFSTPLCVAPLLRFHLRGNRRLTVTRRPPRCSSITVRGSKCGTAADVQVGTAPRANRGVGNRSCAETRHAKGAGISRSLGQRRGL